MTFIPSPQDRERFDTQKAAVLEHLLNGYTITPNEAKAEYGTMRLAARVCELRCEGWNILKTMVPVGENGACVARYSLADSTRRESPFLSVVSENIPDELKRLSQWILWRGVLKGEKMTKIPYAINGHKASSTDPATWTTFETVIEKYNARLYDGIGFVFAVNGGYVGIDLDECFDEAGELIPQATAIVEGIDSYTEYSVSGKGLHVIVRATLDKGKRSGSVEIYPHGRYFTMTGHLFSDSPAVQMRQKQVEHLVQVIEPTKKNTANVNTGAQQQYYSGPYLSNDALIQKAKTARNGEKFTRLWHGDITGYPSSSEADLALLSILLYWANGDEDRTDVLFRQSGLYREKWERTDYRKRCFEYLRGKVTA